MVDSTLPRLFFSLGRASEEAHQQGATKETISKRASKDNQNRLDGSGFYFLLYTNVLLSYTDPAQCFITAGKDFDDLNDLSVDRS